VIARLAAAALIALAACYAQDTVATRACAGCDGGAGGDAGDDRDAYCAGEGPPVLVGDGSGNRDICAGEIAEVTFRFGLCTCADYSSGNTLAIDSFDSRDGPFTAGQAGGSLGVNGTVDANAAVQVRGDVVVSGPGISVTPTLDIGGDLLDQGTLGSASAAVTVAGDASVGDAIGLASLTVAGTLTVPNGVTIDVPGGPSAGALVRAPVSVDPPCACDVGDLLDVPGFVEAHRNNNHNADIGLSIDALDGYADGTELALPCGRFYLTRVRGDGHLTLVVDGRTAVFVAQGLAPQGGLTVRVEPGGELDLFVAGNVDSAGPLELGAPTQPAKVRVYVGGTGVINLSAASTFGGNLYAPLVDLALSGGAELFGSMFVHRVATSGPLTIHYDRAVENAADDCPIL